MPIRDNTELTGRKITKLSCPAEERKEFFDAAARGLALRVSKGDEKVWVVQYRLNKKHHRITLEPYPAMPIEEARAEVRQIRSSAKNGVDPKADREARKWAAQAKAEAEKEARLTFKALARAYIKRGTAHTPCFFCTGWAETEKPFSRHPCRVCSATTRSPHRWRFLSRPQQTGTRPTLPPCAALAWSRQPRPRKAEGGPRRS